jgi:hypothetical protein
MIPVFERAKTFHTLDREATLPGDGACSDLEKRLWQCSAINYKIVMLDMSIILYLKLYTLWAECRVLLCWKKARCFQGACVNKATGRVISTQQYLH